ncbi:MAG TPA: hypothetical protein VFP91_17920 [Vicinamibacterales bacterium]|nr:hypothetical protein [Vicinamibacterales bacterium]
MLWFYTRDRESLQLETRYDNDTLEYVGILTYPDGRKVLKRFADVERFREWLMTIEQNLAAENWNPDGAPHILPDGWPDKTPSH